MKSLHTLNLRISHIYHRNANRAQSVSAKRVIVYLLRAAMTQIAVVLDCKQFVFPKQVTSQVVLSQHTTLPRVEINLGIYLRKPKTVTSKTLGKTK